MNKYTMHLTNAEKIQFNTPAVMTISSKGIWVDPDIETNEAAKQVLEILDGQITRMFYQSVKSNPLLDAAPELLEALERIIENDKTSLDPDDHIFARQAIAKANGERLRISPHGVFVNGVDISQG